MIPRDALFVAHVNLNSMSKKLSWQEIKETDWFKKAYADTSMATWQKKLLENPETSGIDFDKGLVFFVNKGAANNFYLVLEGNIKKEKDFELFNQNFTSSPTVKKTNDINVLTLEDNNVVGWNERRFAYVINTGTSAAEISDWRPVGYQQTQHPVENANDLAIYCASLFTLKADSSLAKNDHFTDLLNDKGDVHFWQNTEAMIKNGPDLGMLGMLKLDLFFKGNFCATTINFNDGKIEMDQKLFTGKELSDFINKYKGSKINTDMIKNIPSQDIIGVFAANFKPEAIQELIKLTGADGFVNMYLQQMGFSLDDLSKANNGDLLIAVSDVNITPDSIGVKGNEENIMNPGNYIKPDFNFLLSMSVKDKGSSQKMAGAIKEMTSQIDSSVSIELNDQYFVISNHKNFADQYLKGGQDNKIDFLDKINGHPIGFFLDIQKILKLTSGNANDSTGQAMLNKSLQIWNNVIMTGGDTKGDALTAHVEVNLMDTKTNSLKQLNNYFNEMYQLNAIKKERNPRLRMLDSLLTPPPMDTIKVQ